MQNPDLGTLRSLPIHPSILCNEIQLAALPRIPAIKLEEDEENSYVIPEGEEALKDWWARFSQDHKYPLYCMILATNADESIATLIDKHRQELAEIAGDKCCLIYFRDIEKAKLLEPFQFAEHATGVTKFIKIIDVQPNQLPCILFFEQITSGEFVLIEVGHKTLAEAMLSFRDIFAFIYSQREVSLRTVKAFRFSTKAKATGRFFMENIKQLSKEIVTDMVKSLAKLP
jgi:hypothetical protein